MTRAQIIAELEEAAALADREADHAGDAPGLVAALRQYAERSRKAAAWLRKIEEKAA